MAKKYSDLAAPLYDTPEGRARQAELKQNLEAEIVAHQLAELRKQLGIDQTELAERLGMTQAGISKLERSADPKLSTLRKLTEALGGTLQIQVSVGDETVSLT